MKTKLQISTEKLLIATNALEEIIKDTKKRESNDFNYIHNEAVVAIGHIDIVRKD